MNRIFILICVCIILCGCSKEVDYSNYKHYDLKENDKLTYTYMAEDGLKQEFAVADITPQGEYDVKEGIFYKVGDDDYIMLDELYPTQNSSYHENPLWYTYFYQDKLFIIRNNGWLALQYTLNKENTKKAEIWLSSGIPDEPRQDVIYLDKSSVTDENFWSYHMEKIENNWIYFKGKTTDLESFDFKCSLDNNKCESIN